MRSVQYVQDKDEADLGLQVRNLVHESIPFDPVTIMFVLPLLQICKVPSDGREKIKRRNTPRHERNWNEDSSNDSVLLAIARRVFPSRRDAAQGSGDSKKVVRMISRIQTVMILLITTWLPVFAPFIIGDRVWSDLRVSTSTRLCSSSPCKVSRYGKERSQHLFVVS